MNRMRHTVDGRNPATLDGWNPRNNGINHLSTGAGFLPSTVRHCKTNSKITGWVSMRFPTFFQPFPLSKSPFPGILCLEIWGWARGCCVDRKHEHRPRCPNSQWHTLADDVPRGRTCKGGNWRSYRRKFMPRNRRFGIFGLSDINSKP